ncbi:MAG: pseudouridine synthase [Thermovirgaceae bacterium]|nr:pseudouridine synthase [Thermovirgaceae bacterium]
MSADPNGTPFRLNRFIAMCKAESRRNADSLIRSGRVEINGSTVRDLSFRVVSEDIIRVDGVHISPIKQVYLIMNKPKGLVCAVTDRFSRTVMDILPREISEAGVFPAGRLDKESEGLLVLTNDGEMAQRITHPSNRILKTYEVLSDRAVSRADLESLLQGTLFGPRIVRPSEARILSRDPAGRWLSITIAEGLKREVRLMAASRGFNVLRLVRRKIGGLELRDLPSGGFLLIEGDRLLAMIVDGGCV